MSLPHDPTAEDLFTLDLDARGLKARALRGSMLSGGVQLVKMILQLGSTIILGRLLFPADFGLVAMVYPVIGFVQLFGNLNFGEVIVQRRELRIEDVSSLFWLNLMIAAGLAAVAFMMSPVVAWIYGEPRVLVLMMAIAAMIPIGALGSIHGAILSRRMGFAAITRNDLASTLLGVVVTIFCAIAHFGYWSLVVGQATTTFLGTGLQWACVAWRPSRPALSSRVWDDIRFGANLTAANLATFLTSSGDNMIIGALNGKEALGIYDRSYRLVVQPLGQMLAPISSVALPLLSRLQTDAAEYRKVYLNFVRIILLFNLPVTLVCITNAQEIVALLLGPQWQAAGPIFAWISVGGLLSGFYSSLSWVFISQGKTPAMRRYMSAAAMFNLASFALGAVWGVIGVAACAAIVFLLITVPMVTYGATRSGPVSLRDVMLCCLPHALTSMAALLLIELLGNNLHMEAPVKLFSSTALCVATFLAVALALPAERQLIRFGWAKITSRLILVGWG